MTDTQPEPIQRKHADFYAREAEIEQFAANLLREPGDPARKTVINVHGLGGVGKSYLLDEFEHICRESGCATAWVREDVSSPLDVLYKFARQMEDQQCNFNKFIDSYDKYLRERGQLEKLTDLGDALGSMLGETAGGLAQTQIPPGYLPAGADYASAGGGVGKTIASLIKNRQIKNRRDANLYPKQTLSGEFLSDLRREAENRLIVLFFDAFEQTAGKLEGWLAQLAAGQFGVWPATCLIVICGQIPLARRHWAGLQAHLMELPLQDFTDTEVHGFLMSGGMQDSRLAREVYETVKGWPLAVNNIRSLGVGAAARLGEVSKTQYSYLFDVIVDPRLKMLAVEGAAARVLNQDVLAAIGSQQPAEDFDWLIGETALLKLLPGDRGWEYHDSARTAAIHELLRRSPKTWRDRHRALAEYYQNLLADEPLPADACRLELLYHRFCASPKKNLAAAINTFVEALQREDDFNMRVARALRQAEADSAIPDHVCWGARMVGALQAYNEEKDVEKTIRLCDQLLHSSMVEPRLHSHLYWQRGASYHAAERYDEAIEDLNEAIQLESDIAEYYKSRGVSYQCLGQHVDAIGDLTHALSLAPSKFYYHFLRGASYHVAGRYEDAIADFTRAIDQSPHTARFYLSRAISYNEVRRFETAIADLTEAICLEPDSAFFYHQRGISYHAAGCYKEAIFDKTRAIDLAPSSPDHRNSDDISNEWIKLNENVITKIPRVIEREPGIFEYKFSGSVSYDWSKRNKKEIANKTRLSDLVPGNIEYYASRAISFLAAGRYEEAIGDLTRVIEQEPSNVQCYYLRGISYHEAGNYREAITDKVRALELEQNNTEYQVSLDMSYEWASLYEEIIADKTRAIECEPENAKYYFSRGTTYQLARRYDEAIYDKTRAIEFEPDNHEYYFSRGVSYHEARRYEEAINDKTRAIDLASSYAEYYYSRGLSYHEAGFYAEAINDMTYAIQLEPSNAEFHFARATSLHAIENYIQEIEDETRAIELRPNTLEYYTTRSLSLRIIGRTDEAEADEQRAQELRASP